MNRLFWPCVLGAVACAVALRSARLELRPVHSDEAVNAVIFSTLLEKGRYVYQPAQFHGPTLYYCALPVARAFGAHSFGDLSEKTLRTVPVIFGICIVVLVLLFRDGLGNIGTVTAAALGAVSPALVFYSRYFIHETLLVFFTGLALGAGWRWVKTRRFSWAVVCGASLGAMHATKETFVLALGAMCVAAALTIWLEGMRINLRGITVQRQSILHLLAAFFAGAVVSVTLFSSFFSHMAGVVDSIRGFFFWFGHAQANSIHTHPWHFYLHRLVLYADHHGHVWTEGVIVLLAFVGAVASLTGKSLGTVNPVLARFLSVYTLVLTVVYSVIPYKTPWCMLGFLHGMTILAGIGVAVLVRVATRTSVKLILYLLLCAATVHLCWQTWALNFRYFAHRTNPYVYAQTVPDVLRLVNLINGISTVAPEGTKMLVKVVAPEHDYWPLPWYLRKFERVGWWDKIPDDPYAPVMVMSSKLNIAFDEITQKHWLMVGLFELRPYVFFELYVDADLWRKYVAALPTLHD